MKRKPWELTFEEFTGPAMVGDVFATPGRDMDQYDWLWNLAANATALGTPAWSGQGGYEVRELLDCEPPGTFVLIAPDGAPCGFYMDSGLWIDPEHRGKELSTPLILAAATFHGGSPTNNVEGLGFSEAGYTAHRRAHRHAVLEAFEAGSPVPKEVLAEYEFGKSPIPTADRSMSTIYVVLNENTLGYVQTPDTRIMGVLHGSVLRGGHDWKNGGVAVTPGIDSLRPATEEDFAAYRVKCPPNFRPVTAQELDAYRIMRPILPEPEQVSEPEAERTPPFRP